MENFNGYLKTLPIPLISTFRASTSATRRSGAPTGLSNTNRFHLSSLILITNPPNPQTNMISLSYTISLSLFAASLTQAAPILKNKARQFSPQLTFHGADPDAFYDLSVPGDASFVRIGTSFPLTFSKFIHTSTLLD